MRKQIHIKLFLILFTTTFCYFASAVHGSGQQDQEANASNSAADDARALRASIIARVGSFLCAGLRQAAVLSHDQGGQSAKRNPPVRLHTDMVGESWNRPRY